MDFSLNELACFLHAAVLVPIESFGELEAAFTEKFNTFEILKYTNDDELAFASASLAYRREELEARLRGNATIGRGMEIGRSRHGNISNESGLALNNGHHHSSDINVGNIRHSLDIPGDIQNVHPSIFRNQASIHSRWGNEGGSRLIQQRSFELHPQTNHHGGLAPPSSENVARRSFDDASYHQMLNARMADTSTHTSNNANRNSEREEHYVGGADTNNFPLNSLPTGKTSLDGKPYFDHPPGKAIRDNHQTGYGNETIVRDYKPKYSPLYKNRTERGNADFLRFNEPSACNNIQLNQTNSTCANNNPRVLYDMTGSKKTALHNVAAAAHKNPFFQAHMRQSEKGGGFSASMNNYSDGNYDAGGISNGDDQFCEQDYHRQLIIDHENCLQQPSSEMGKKGLKSRPIQWWKEQLSSTSNLSYGRSNNRYDYDSYSADGRVTNGEMRNKGALLYPTIHGGNLPDVTGSILNPTDQYHSSSNFKALSMEAAAKYNRNTDGHPYMQDKYDISHSKADAESSQHQPLLTNGNLSNKSFWSKWNPKLQGSKISDVVMEGGILMDHETKNQYGAYIKHADHNYNDSNNILDGGGQYMGANYAMAQQQYHHGISATHVNDGSGAIDGYGGFPNSHKYKGFNVSKY